MQKYKFIGMSSIIAKVNRDFRGMEMDDNDLIEWISEALGRMKVHGASQEATLFAEVKNHMIDLPSTMHNIIQVAQDTKWKKGCNTNLCPDDILCSVQEAVVPEKCVEKKANTCCVEVDCHGYAVDAKTATPIHYRSRFNLNNYYPYWLGSSVYRERYCLVTLADHTFFNSIVCQPDNNPYNNHNIGVHNDQSHGRNAIGNNGKPEFTIVGDSREAMKFSFKEGYVAVSYTRQPMKDGLPMIPDHEYAREAMGYYIAWKLHQRESYLHREGARTLATEARIQWLKYCGMFKSNAKMPHGEAEYLALREQMLYILPRLDRPYKFYGDMSSSEQRPYNNTH